MSWIVKVLSIFPILFGLFFAAEEPWKERFYPRDVEAAFFQMVNDTNQENTIWTVPFAEGPTLIQARTGVQVSEEPTFPWFFDTSPEWQAAEKVTLLGRPMFFYVRSMWTAKRMDTILLDVWETETTSAPFAYYIPMEAWSEETLSVIEKELRECYRLAAWFVENYGPYDTLRAVIDRGTGFDGEEMIFSANVQPLAAEELFVQGMLEAVMQEYQKGAQRKENGSTEYERTFVSLEAEWPNGAGAEGYLFAIGLFWNNDFYPDTPNFMNISHQLSFAPPRFLPNRPGEDSLEYLQNMSEEERRDYVREFLLPAFDTEE